jgi:hypothetical protein
MYGKLLTVIIAMSALPSQKRTLGQPLMRSAAPCVVLAIFGSATRCT